MNPSTRTTGEATGSNRLPNRIWIWLALLVLLSLAVRVGAWAYWRTGSIESEGAEYARLAENLRKGVGFVGLVTPGPQLNFNPLFPLLIAGASFLTHGNYEVAGRLVALVLGSLLPLPVFGIGSRLFDRRAGMIAALLVAFHPLLVHLSFTVFSEGPYATFLLFAAYIAVRALEQPSYRNWFLVGGAFALAWLVRAEAFVAFDIVILFALAVSPGNMGTRCKRAAAAIFMFMLLISPQVIFIYRSTGKLKLEGKSVIFFYDAKRILAADRNSGLEYLSPGGHRELPSPEPNVPSWQRWQDKWAFFGIDSDGKGMGFPLRPHVEIIRDTHIRPKELLTIALTGTRQNAPLLLQRLSSDWFGAPLLPALALLGAMRRPWRGTQALTRLFIVMIASAPVLATFLALRTEQRYYFILIPLFTIFAANGLVGVGLWTSASTAAAGWQILHRPIVSHAILPGLIGLALVVGTFPGLKRVYIFDESAVPTRIDKEIGVWIGQRQTGAVKIMDLSTQLAFHAGAQFTYFPYCDGDMALRYVDAQRVDYIVLRRDQNFTKYYQDWTANGLRDKRAELVPTTSVAGADKFVLYHWHHS